MKRKLICLCIIGIACVFLFSAKTWSNPWNGKVVLQASWWDCWNEQYPQDWYTYLAKLSPRLRALGFDDRFLRTWLFYLCYCEAGFDQRQVGVSQLLLTKPACRREPLLAEC